MSWISRTGLMAGIVATTFASTAYGQVRRPSTGHAAYNFIPFHGTFGQDCTMHQVFASTLWSGPMEISALGFGPWDGNNGQAYEGDIIIRLGYTGPNGSGQVNGRAGTRACGGFVQLVVADGRPCTTSNVVQIP